MLHELRQGLARVISIRRRPIARERSHAKVLEARVRYCIVDGGSHCEYLRRVHQPLFPVANTVLTTLIPLSIPFAFFPRKPAIPSLPTASQHTSTRHKAPPQVLELSTRPLHPRLTISARDTLRNQATARRTRKPRNHPPRLLLPLQIALLPSPLPALTANDRNGIDPPDDELKRALLFPKITAAHHAELPDASPHAFPVPVMRPATRVERGVFRVPGRDRASSVGRDERGPGDREAAGGGVRGRSVGGKGVFV